MGATLEHNAMGRIARARHVNLARELGNLDALRMFGEEPAVEQIAADMAERAIPCAVDEALRHLGVDLTRKALVAALVRLEGVQ